MLLLAQCARLMKLVLTDYIIIFPLFALPLDEKARHKGVMVVFNDEIHTARNVTKTHTSNTNTFQSPNHGPLGVLTKDRVQFHHMPYRQQALENVNDKLNVPLVKAYMGMPGDILVL